MRRTTGEGSRTRAARSLRFARTLLTLAEAVAIAAAAAVAFYILVYQRSMEQREGRPTVAITQQFEVQKKTASGFIPVLERFSLQNNGKSRVELLGDLVDAYGFRIVHVRQRTPPLNPAANLGDWSAFATSDGGRLVYTGEVVYTPERVKGGSFAYLEPGEKVDRELLYIIPPKRFDMLYVSHSIAYTKILNAGVRVKVLANKLGGLYFDETRAKACVARGVFDQNAECPESYSEAGFYVSL